MLGNKTATLLAHWPMVRGEGGNFEDVVGGNNMIAESASVVAVAGPSGADGAIRLNGGNVASKCGVVKSDESFSVAAWVRLDSDVAGADLVMPPNWFAWTAVAQSGPYHSSFYIGARQIEYGGEGTGDFHLHWNFTVAPADGSDDGPIDWVHAHSSKELFGSEADEWVLLVGVYDLEAGVARIYVPTRTDSGEQILPEGWTKWHGAENVQVGHAWFRDEFVDNWPGSVGPVWLFSGVLSEGDAQSLCEKGVLEAH